MGQHKKRKNQHEIRVYYTFANDDFQSVFTILIICKYSIIRTKYEFLKNFPFFLYVKELLNPLIVYYYQKQQQQEYICIDVEINFVIAVAPE